MNLGQTLSTLVAAVVAGTMGVHGLIAISLCVAGVVVVTIIDARTRIHLARIDAFPDLMRRRLKWGGLRRKARPRKSP